MTASPQTWHYGLVARWWAEFEVGGPEIGYFQDMIGVYGQPALDVGCGTGRLLLPYLRAGLDVDGCDVSSDMIDLYRERGESWTCPTSTERSTPAAASAWEATASMTARP